MLFGTTVGLELGLLLLCYREGLRCDLWCLVLRPGLEHVPPEIDIFTYHLYSHIHIFPQVM